jgi:uncharacterized heparinase superfamily protein
MENARALVLAGSFFDGPDADRWLRKGAAILRRQLVEQVLPHGEHFERSSMYHAIMLEALLDVADAARPVDAELARRCDGATVAMATFLRAILHPDGEIPLLGDACFGQSAAACPLIARAARGADERPARAALQPTPSPGAHVWGQTWTYRNSGDFVLFDAGPVGPDHLPAHAHADLLHLEASVAGRRLLVDSGVFDYALSPMRRYCRSTQAHNTLEIDDRNQCDMWSRFRMGHRGWPGKLATGHADGFDWARAEHNAYRRLGVPRVGRWIGCRPGGPWLCVDWCEGTGAHRLVNRLHFHPDVTVEEVAGDEVKLTLSGLALRLRFATTGQVTVDTSWYCPELGLRLPRPVVCWMASSALPAVCAWSLTWGNNEGRASLEWNATGTCLLHWTEPERRVCLQPVGRPLYPGVPRVLKKTPTAAPSTSLSAEENHL